MKFRNKLICLCLALFLLIPYASIIVQAVDEQTTIEIATADEFIEFAKKCTLDSWSDGKTVNLTENINLGDNGNITIPIFAGTFNGGEHTISGLNITGSGSTLGLFRYIQEGASVTQLTVEGTVTPDGTADSVGGIAGSNAGTIRDCVFHGTVMGKNAVGGIAGTNEGTGQIISSTANGIIDGVCFVGGIAGVNNGTVSSSTNSANVGTNPQDGNVTDIGGIAGYSKGQVQSSTNNGTVGALHTGYNIGGVVGRQDGLVSNSVNTGAVYGRKDVGGIVGQAEPNITVVFSSDILEELNAELNTLYSLINGTLSDSNNISSDTQRRLENMSKYLDDASSNANTLLSSISSAVNNSTGSSSNLNTASALIYANLGNYESILKSILDLADELADITDEVSSAVTKISSITDVRVASISAASRAASNLSDAIKAMDEAISKIDSDLKSLRNAVNLENEKNIQSAVENLKGDFTALGNAFDDCSDAVSDLRTNLSGMLSGDNANQTKARNALEDLSDAFEDMADAADAIANAVGGIEAKVDVNWTKLTRSLSSIKTGVDNMSKASGNAKKAMDDMTEALDDFSSSSTTLNRVVDDLVDAAEQGSDAFRDLTSYLSRIAGYVSDLGDRDPSNPSSSKPLGSSYNNQSQALYRAIVNMSSELTSLNTDLNKGNKDYSNDMKSLNDQMPKVMGLVIEALEDKGNTGNVDDVSNDNTANALSGKITGSTNSGIITGDRDIGGIVGAMAIENALEPEDEQNDVLPSDNNYEIFNVITSCLNDGTVSGTKDYVGGIVGRMDLGAATDNENYGRVESVGNYVGGIAGLSEATVKRNYSKSIISGNDYVGGIVGQGTNVEACYAIVVIEDGNEFVGAIAGWGDISDNSITKNYYVDNGVAAIDNVSYHEIAEPMTLENMQSQSGIPSGFTTFTVTCIANGEIVETLTIPYGTAVSDIELPEVPKSSERDGIWSEFQTDTMLVNQTLYAQYDQWTTILSSEENDEGRTFALAEGRFTHAAKLHVYVSDETPPSRSAWAVWDVFLSDTGITDTSTTTIRLLNQTGRTASIWQLRNGQWVKLDTTRSGQYLIASMTGTKGTFCMRVDYMPLILIALISVCVVVAIVVTIILIVRRNRRNKGMPVKSRKKTKKKNGAADKSVSSAEAGIEAGSIDIEALMDAAAFLDTVAPVDAASPIDAAAPLDTKRKSKREKKPKAEKPKKEKVKKEKKAKPEKVKKEKVKKEKKYFSRKDKFNEPSPYDFQFPEDNFLDMLKNDIENNNTTNNDKQ